MKIEMNMENKALALIVEQEKQKDMVHFWTWKISEGLSKCGLSVFDNRKNHLSEAYQIVSYYPDGETISRDDTEEDQINFLKSVCEHCLSAHQAVSERKIVRKKIGIIKSKITKLAMKKIREDLSS